jgi:hypothetical protein
MEVLSTKDLFQVLLLIYQAELDGKILNTNVIKESIPFKTPKIIGKLSFNPDSEFTIKLNESSVPFSQEKYEDMVKAFSLNLKTPGVYKLLFQPKFLNECIIKYNPAFSGIQYQKTPEFKNVLRTQVIPSREDILKENYTREQLNQFDLTKLRAIYASLMGKKYRAPNETEDIVKNNLINIILNEINPLKNALLKHWPVIENNTSWVKVFDRLNLTPETSEDIYETKKDDENYLKCLGYIGILLDHLDRAEPLPTDLYGKCLNLSERIL